MYTIYIKKIQTLTIKITHLHTISNYFIKIDYYMPPISFFHYELKKFENKFIWLIYNSVSWESEKQCVDREFFFISKSSISEVTFFILSWMYSISSFIFSFSIRRTSVWISLTCTSFLFLCSLGEVTGTYTHALVPGSEVMPVLLATISESVS